MGSELIIKIGASSKAFQDELDKIAKQTKDLEKQLKSIAQVSGIAFVALAGSIGLSVKAFADFETAVVGVAKTTDLSKKAAFEFGKELQTLSRTLPVASNELLAIAQVGGQLGVQGRENLLKFTETIAKLGVATDLSGEKAALSLTRILNVTKEGVGAIDVFGSVIVRLGNNFAATESEIVRVATEVARSTSQFKIGSTNVAAIATALKATGVQAQLGGSAVGRAFRQIDASIREGGESLEALSAITGILGEDLQKTFQEDATKVFQAFINGLGDIQAANGDVVGALGTFGLKGDEINKVLPVLAGNTDLFAEALRQASKEAKDPIALNEEAAAAFNTLNSRVILAKNAFTEIAVAIGKEFAPAANTAVRAITDFLRQIRDNKPLLITAARIAGVATALTGLVFVLATSAIAFIKFRRLLIAVLEKVPLLSKSLAFAKTAVTEFLKPILKLTIALIKLAAQGLARATMGILNLGRRIPGVQKIILIFNATISGITKAAKRAGLAVLSLAKKPFVALLLSLKTAIFRIPLVSKALTFLNLATKRAAIGFKALGFSIRGLLAATGIGLLIVVITDLALNFDVRMAQIESIFKRTAKNIGGIASGLGNLLAGAFTFDKEQVKAGFDELKAALKNSISEISKDFKTISSGEEVSFLPTVEEIKEKGEKNTEAVVRETRKSSEAQLKVIKESKEARVKQEKEDEKERKAANELRRKESLASFQAETQLLELENQGASERLIEFKRREVDLLKQIEDTGNKERLTALNVQLQAVQADREEFQALDAERRLILQEEILIENEEFQALTFEQQQEFIEQNQEQLLEQINTKAQIKKTSDLKEVKDDIKRREQFLKDERQFGTFIAQFKMRQRGDNFSNQRQALNNLSALQQSENSKLKAIGKAAAIVNITLSTAQGAIGAYAALAPIPIVGPGLGIAAAAALIAFGGEQVIKVGSAAQGALVEGPGLTDSVPFMLAPGELVAPRQNFDEVIDAVGRQRVQNDLAEADPLENATTSSPEDQDPTEIIISLDGEEAESMITARQNENKLLGLDERV